MRKKDENETTDIRDLLGQIGRLAGSAAGDKIPATPEAIKATINQARFHGKTKSAITRLDVQQALTYDRNRRAKAIDKNTVKIDIE